ncbi:MAG: hypothetical protein OER21_15715 [Gemmatimonadota bacterium]|nr:hypothetical protein [Gemmatimonadota bacterium]
MIELHKDQLIVRFPDVHADAELRIDFQRTLRIPDDDREYPLPAGLGRFPLRHVDDFAERVPARWLEHGGVLLPMYQSEALWINFDGGYPCAVKIAAGKINAVTGDAYRPGLHRGPQDYAVTPGQPWLDGFCVEKGIIRQFVAMPLGAGYSAEEQITGAAEHGGLQLHVYPIKRQHYRPPIEGASVTGAPLGRALFAKSFDMGLAPGGRMRQEIYRDHRPLDVWDLDHGHRCFVHLANSLVWRAITGEEPPSTPLTARDYARAHIPWFEYYAEGETAVDGAGVLQRLKSVVAMGKAKGDVPLPENESLTPQTVIDLRRGLVKGQVREGRF